jgi:hypothetical protein
MEEKPKIGNKKLESEENDKMGNGATVWEQSPERAKSE